MTFVTTVSPLEEALAGQETSCLNIVSKKIANTLHHASGCFQPNKHSQYQTNREVLIETRRHNAGMKNCCVVRYTLPPTGQLHLAAGALELGGCSEYEAGA